MRVLIIAAVIVAGMAGVAVAAEQKLPGSDIIPAERLADWRPGVTVGVPGGIPTDRDKLIDVTKEPYNADKTGQTDASAAIQQAIKDAKDKEVVYLPAGTYRTDKTIGMGKSNITLRGDGPEKTVILPQCQHAISIVGRPGGSDWWYANRLRLSITGSPKRGSTELTVGDTKALKVGDICQLRLMNDPKVPVIAPAHWEYMQRQESRIVAKTETTVTISPGLLYDLPESLSPQLAPCGGHADFVGIEDLAVDGKDGKAVVGVQMNAAYGCWLKNVKVVNIRNYHVSLGDSVQCEIRHCTIAKRLLSGSNGAGILFGTSSSCLIEDNILLEQFPHLEANAATGNVFAYNFCKDSSIFEGDFGLEGCSIGTNHGAQSCYNLYEGNVSPKLQSDGYHGGSSYDTVFRNWLHGTDEKTNNFWICINLNRFTRYYSIVGNVLGKKGYAWIYDNCDEGFLGGGYEQHFIYLLGMPGMGNIAFNGQRVQPSKGKNWPDWDKMIAAEPGKGPGPNGFGELDLDVAATTIRLGNYNYKDNGVPESESLKGAKLPKSLYLTEKPKWFGKLAWPPFGPDTEFEKNKIPAQVRFEAMTKSAK